MKNGWPLLLLSAFASLSGCSGQPAIVPGGIISNNPCIDNVLAVIASPGDIQGVSIYSHVRTSASAPVDWARKFPAIGTSAEEIIAARPKMLLTGNFASSSTNVALQKTKIPMLALGVAVTLEEDQDQIRQIARAIGREAAGETLIAKIVAATKPQAGNEGERPSAIIWQSGGFVAGQGTFQDEMLARAGFTNASMKYGLRQWDILPLETLIDQPPAVIFMPVSAHGEDGRALAMRQRLLRHLKAQTRIVEFPDRLLFCGGPTVIKAMQIMRYAYDKTERNGA